MKQYLDALRYVYENGEDKTDRTGVGTRSVFGYQMRFDLSQGFPAVTTKKLAWKAVVSELLWFLEGSTDERRLAEIHYGADRTELCGKTTIWTANADKQGRNLGYVNDAWTKELGPVYGYQWRNFDGDMRHDQIEWVVNELCTNPDSRRIILSAWNPKQLDKMALPPCHTLAQFGVSNGKLSCHLFQRSADMFLGVPFNIASYALLTHMLASHTGLEVGALVHTISDAHIYKNHVSQVEEQLNRQPTKSPRLVMPEITSFDTHAIRRLKVADFKLEDYDPQASISAPMAV